MLKKFASQTPTIVLYHVVPSARALDQTLPSSPRSKTVTEYEPVTQHTCPVTQRVLMCVQLRLAADYAPGSVMELLVASSSVPLEAALAVCEERGLVAEQVRGTCTLSLPKVSRKSLGSARKLSTHHSPDMLGRMHTEFSSGHNGIGPVHAITHLILARMSCTMCANDANWCVWLHAPSITCRCTFWGAWAPPRARCTSLSTSWETYLR